MREPNKKTKIWLGTFRTVEMATRAHDVAALALRGRYACLNFADSAWRLPIPASMETKDIQKAAAEAAEAFKPDNILLTSDIDTVVAANATEEQLMFSMEEEEEEEKEEEVLNIPESLRNMALMSPTHSFEHEYQGIDADFQDIEVSLWSFSI